MRRGAAWLLALLLAAWLPPLGAARAAEPIRIGLILPMTGPAAAYGEMALAGIRLAEGQRKEVLGRPVELILTDDKSDKVESTNAANRLIQRDRVVAIIGALSSSPTMAAAPIAERARVPMISGWATNPLVTQGRKYVFRVCFIDPFQGGVAASFAYRDLKARRAAVLLDVSRDYSVGLASFFEKSFKNLGGAIVTKALYNSGDQDFSAQLGTIAAASPDLIYLPGYLPEEPLIIRQAREMGLTQPFLSGDAAQSDELLKIGGPAVEGLHFTTHFDEEGATTPEGQAYGRAYREKYQKAPDALGALGYDVYNIVLAALERAGSTDPDALVRALERTRDFPGVCGPTTIEGRDAVKPAVILKVKDGKFVYVTTVAPR